MQATIGELLNFNLYSIETKMRDIISQQLAPYLSRAEQDHSIISELNQANKANEQKLHELEQVMYGDGGKSMLVKTINDKFQDIHSKALVQQKSIEQNISLNDAQIACIKKDIDTLTHSSNFIARQNEQSLSTIEKIMNTLTTYKQDIVSLMEDSVSKLKIQCEVINMRLSNHEQALVELRSDSKSTSHSISTIYSKIEFYSGRIEKIFDIVGDLQKEKLNRSEMNETFPLIKNDIKNLQIYADKNWNSHIYLENFIDKYHPLFIQKMISDCLTSILPISLLKKLELYESNLYNRQSEIIANDDGIPHLNRESLLGKPRLTRFSKTQNGEGEEDIEAQQNNEETLLSKLKKEYTAYNDERFASAIKVQSDQIMEKITTIVKRNEEKTESKFKEYD